MDTLRVLIVEDEPQLADHLEEVVREIVPAAVTRRRSAAGAKEALAEPFDFAFLDVDVTNGQTFEVARLLAGKQVPFAFVSGGGKHRVPPELRSAPFIAKPYRLDDIEEALKGAAPES